MWENIFEMATKSGIWAVLFVSLFFIQLKDSKSREGKYQQTIESLADKLKVVMEIQECVDDIKTLFDKNSK